MWEITYIKLCGCPKMFRQKNRDLRHDIQMNGQNGDFSAFPLTLRVSQKTFNPCGKERKDTFAEKGKRAKKGDYIFWVRVMISCDVGFCPSLKFFTTFALLENSEYKLFYIKVWFLFIIKWFFNWFSVCLRKYTFTKREMNFNNFVILKKIF